MRTRTKLFAGAALVAVAAIGWDLLDRTSDVVEVRANPWPAGLQLRYDFAWKLDSELAAGGSGIAAHIDLAATLTITSHGDVLAASLDDITAHQLELLGKHVFADAAAARAQLVGHTAWLVLAANGTVERVYFDPKASPAFKHLMQSALPMTQIARADAAKYTTTEPGPSGLGRVTYRRDGRSLTRTRDAYEQLTVVPDASVATPELAGTASITLDAGDRIAKLADDERLVLRVPGSATPLYEGTSRFTLALVGTNRVVPAAPPVLAQLHQRRPGELVLDGDVERAHLEQRANGLTLERLTSGFRRAWGSARDDKRIWVSQAVALVKLDPSLVDEIVELGFGDGSDARTRSLAFDLLASAGHAEAQAAMRDVLASQRTDFVDLVQRFSIVAAPTAETVEFVLAEYRTATGSAQIATSYTLGSLAKHVRVADPKLAAEVEGTLRGNLADAQTPQARAHAITALGNAALADDVRPYATDVDAEVRAGVARALRHTATPAARDTLVKLAADADVNVARAALAVFGKQSLDAETLDRLERVTPSHPATDAALLDVLGRNAHQNVPAVRRMLEAIDARAASNPHLQERTRVLLAQLP